MAKIAINGLGRVGRQVLKHLITRYPELEIVAANDIADEQTLAHLLKYDSNYGTWDIDIEGKEGAIVIGGREVKIFREKDPAALPWGKLGIDIVIESTGMFTDADKARGHITAGAKKVLITAPAKGEDITIVLGVNEDLLDVSKHSIISNASCTTNSLAPVVKVLNDNWGVEKGYMTTVHSYTLDQRILDAPHKDLRRARNAATNIIPTTTGASKAVALVIPEMKGKLDGISLRVPTSTVSITVFDAILTKPATREEINAALKEASEKRMKGFLGYNELPLVSSDYRGTIYSGIVDGLSTKSSGTLVQVLSWYDNEWGYSARVADLTKLIVTKASY
ncbi:type I glyceraldehyde-3-phosphate dehydrogenase [Candidatus Cryosericum hinesii]|jgi:glyceraldehyde 3-phosphate dehydrogenase|uniref:Glyceraldehyde-3-phosphate dehydrogenase n=1 Tax=Candidatus Cryosericum hinesii TaxID=2290915 RepID=A0A398DEI2_9BACT|nr:type I glyceraldehyde-3-phosphate dehydrogenase [Candidatus Cryosericum hinesii]RIE09897.1 type I glyceraldehyde-3-phosphate dehydrogenase [Candidatus Cryosericum hinesii]RIE14036.1 type I glyceraldehyde-3-phosphate dehydrogenase [Candidatus Cryosericum hinesii]RIE15051.1 type I glyceraldehyde-3-phosphate dehydrogenase [Candidatus Cryosericum hinesii]